MLPFFRSNHTCEIKNSFWLREKDFVLFPYKTHKPGIGAFSWFICAWVHARMLGERVLGLVVHFPSWNVDKINILWPWLWLWPVTYAYMHICHCRRYCDSYLYMKANYTQRQYTHTNIHTHTHTQTSILLKKQRQWPVYKEYQKDLYIKRDKAVQRHHLSMWQIQWYHALEDGRLLSLSLSQSQSWSRSRARARLLSLSLSLSLSHSWSLSLLRTQSQSL